MLGVIGYMLKVEVLNVICFSLFGICFFAICHFLKNSKAHKVLHKVHNETAN